MVQLRVQTEDLHQMASTVQRDAAEAEAILTKLNGDAQALAGTWQGPASQAFHHSFAQWQQQWHNVKTLLENLGQSLNAAGTNYEDVESQIAKSMPG